MESAKHIKPQIMTNIQSSQIPKEHHFVLSLGKINMVLISFTLMNGMIYWINLSDRTE